MEKMIEDNKILDAIAERKKQEITAMVEKPAKVVGDAQLAERCRNSFISFFGSGFDTNSSDAQLELVFGALCDGIISELENCCYKLSTDFQTIVDNIRFAKLNGMRVCYANLMRSLLDIIRNHP